MDFSWIESILYGLISGFTEFIPVSSMAHKALLYKLFGISEQPYLLDLFCRIAAISGFVLSFRSPLERLSKEYRLLHIPKSQRPRRPDAKTLADISLVRGAILFIIIILLLYLKTRSWCRNLIIVSVFLLINGILLYFPSYIPQGNKDARSMTKLDSFLLGLSSGLGVIPGLSSVSTTSAISTLRGAEHKESLVWSFLLTTAVMVGLCFFDLILFFIGGFSGLEFIHIIQAIVSAVFSLFGSYFSVKLMYFMAYKVGFSAFSYYSWGAALLSFILYLTV